MTDVLMLSVTACSIGVVHTLLGPDHYVPFVVLAKARNWSLPRTLSITAWCGLGHVAGSFLLGLLGLTIGTVLGEIESIEAVRGNLAAWSLIIFGLVYFLWGTYAAICSKSGSNLGVESQTHSHSGFSHRRTTFALMVVFVLGPCEALIPVLMYPAAATSSVSERALGVSMVVFAFGVATIFTMLVCVFALFFGVRGSRFTRLGSFQHALAGVAILICGLGIHLGA